MKILTKENCIIISTIFSFFLLFLFTWSVNEGAWVFGLYSEVDGQLAAWLSKYLLIWGKPFDMNTLNPFQGMGSVFLPMNSWWDPGALALGLPASNFFKYLFSYSIYWFEIFFATYFLAKTSGLSKIESIFAAELFVFILFPPFSAYFSAVAFFSLAPMYAHWMAIVSIITISYIKLGEGSVRYNLFLTFMFVFAIYLLVMTAGAYFASYIPVYALFASGFVLHNLNRKMFLWKIGALFLVMAIFFISHGDHYYKDTLGYISAIVEIPKETTITMPTTFKKHAHLLFGQAPFFIYFQVLALLGSLVGLFIQKGKFRRLALSFFIIAVIPDAVAFVLENGIVSGGSISQINNFFYLWAAYPLYCIFFTVLISFLWQGLAHRIAPVGSRYLDKYLPKLNIDSQSSSLLSLKVLLPLIIIPVFATKIWFGTPPQSRTDLKEPAQTPIISHLEEKIALSPGDVFRGATVAYFSSENSPLRPFLKTNDDDTYANMNDYIQAREFLNRRFGNRYMFSDLWNFSIPTLEEYGHLISSPMYVFFQRMLANKGDILNRHFLNVYKLDLKVLRALGARFIITDRILKDKDLALVLKQNQTDTKNYVDYPVSLSAKTIFSELAKKHKNDVILNTDFMKKFRDKLNKTNPSAQTGKDIVYSFLGDAAKSVLDNNQTVAYWSYKDLEKVGQIFNVMLYIWTVSPPLYLYEIKNPNLADFSPTQTIQSNSVHELFRYMKKPTFSFEKIALIQQPLPQGIASRLVVVKKSEMRFEKNAVHIKATSDGWTLLLLPLQYSHCFRLTEATPTSIDHESPRPIRANLIHEALLFKGKIDAKLNFDFGIGRNSFCRQKDIQDMKELGLTYEKLYT